MCCLDLAPHIVCIEVEAIEIGAHGVQRIFMLHEIRADIQHAMFDLMALTNFGGGHDFLASDNSGCGCCACRNTEANAFQIILSHVETLPTAHRYINRYQISKRINTK